MSKTGAIRQRKDPVLSRNEKRLSRRPGDFSLSQKGVAPQGRGLSPVVLRPSEGEILSQLR